MIIYGYIDWIEVYLFGVGDYLYVCGCGWEWIVGVEVGLIVVVDLKMGKNDLELDFGVFEYV